MIPFFVADRPISLQILNCFFSLLSHRDWGILTHAFTSKRFKELFKFFPNKSPCPLSENEIKIVKNFIGGVNTNKNIKGKVWKIVDSGIFHTKRDVSYEELFSIYDSMESNFGIIIDYLKDSLKTLKSAEKALKVYSSGIYNFELVGVAQGNNLNEYLNCFSELQKMGYKYIAVGGLLKRNGSSSILSVEDEKFLEILLREIREKFNPEWLFALGVFHPKRVEILKKYKVWGADYKGWIFQYDYSLIKSLPQVRNLVPLLQEIKRKNDKKLKKELKEKLNKELIKQDLSLQKIRIMEIVLNLTKQLGEIL